MTQHSPAHWQFHNRGSARSPRTHMHWPSLEADKPTGLGSRLLIQTEKDNAALRTLYLHLQIILWTRMTARDRP